MDLGLAGNGYIVVGGTAGMGLATAQVLVEEGASVVVIGRSEARGEAAAASLRDQGNGQTWAVSADVSRSGEIERAVDDAVSRLAAAGIDHLGGVAVFTGVLGHEPLDMPDDRWTAAFGDVLLGTVRSVQACLPHLRAGDGGTVVTTSAFSIRSPQAVRLPYASLKGAVAIFTKGVAKEYGQHGIRANCICPGAIETDSLHQYRAVLAEQYGYPVEEAVERAMVEQWDLDVALGRPGQPREVAELAAFLLSPRAGYLTGALVNIDGGTDF